MCARLPLRVGAAAIVAFTCTRNAAATPDIDWIIKNGPFWNAPEGADTRILGGREELGSYQWMASIRRGRLHSIFKSVF